jgi:hypothetical protein
LEDVVQLCKQQVALYLEVNAEESKVNDGSDDECEHTVPVAAGVLLHAVIHRAKFRHSLFRKAFFGEETGSIFQQLLQLLHSECAPEKLITEMPEELLREALAGGIGASTGADPAGGDSEGGNGAYGRTEEYVPSMLDGLEWMDRLWQDGDFQSTPFVAMAGVLHLLRSKQGNRPPGDIKINMRDEGCETVYRAAVALEEAADLLYPHVLRHQGQLAHDAVQAADALSELVLGEAGGGL